MARRGVRLWPLAVVARVVVAAVLVVGPTTDEPAELAGWDAERFQKIAERSAPAWAEVPVEYPPGSVVIIDRVAGADVVDTHRRLVTLSLALDLATAALLWRRIGAGAGRAFLWIGLALVPFGYQRLDTLVTFLAALGLVALVAGAGARAGGRGEDGSLRGGAVRPRPTSGLAADGLAGAALAAGALVKVWPLVLVVAATAVGRWRAAAITATMTGIAGVVWLGATGAGLEPVDQILSLRGATGWHVESLPGALVALTTEASARLELDAYRIGTLRPSVVTVGRGLAVVAMGALALVGWRRDDGASTIRTVALTGLGSTAALVSTAPLLSPQFLVWLLPSIALLAGAPIEHRRPLDRWIIGATTLAAVLTGLTLHGFGPAALDRTAPAALLTVRNGVLVGLPPLCLAALAGIDRLGAPGPAPRREGHAARSS